MKYTPYSELKVFHHTDQIKGLINAERVAPIYVRIKPTNICNQGCRYCVYADDQVFEGRSVDRRESISWELMDRTLRELKDLGTRAVTFSGGGEPLCYHSIVKTLELTQKLGFDYSMITNGQALEGEPVDVLHHAKWIRVSFDSYESETYRAIRNVDTHSKVVRNIENFAKNKDETCTLGINCVVTKQNAGEIYNICKLMKSIGVDNIKLSPIAVKQGDADYHESIKDSVYAQIIEAKKQLEDSTFQIIDKYTDDMALDANFQKAYTRCYIQEIFTVIAADSKVYRCHQRAYTRQGEIGDLTQKSFKEIWYSQETIDSCRKWNACEQCQFRCAFDERNILLNDFMNLDRNHVNFI